VYRDDLGTRTGRRLQERPKYPKIIGEAAAAEARRAPARGDLPSDERRIETDPRGARDLRGGAQKAIRHATHYQTSGPRCSRLSFKNKGVQAAADAVVGLPALPVDRHAGRRHRTDQGEEQEREVVRKADDSEPSRRSPQDHDGPIRRQAHVLPCLTSGRLERARPCSTSDRAHRADRAVR